MIFFQAYEKYATFSGRAGRPEFWWFVMFWLPAFACLLYLGSLVGLFLWLALAYFLVSFVPFLAVGTRRLHDTGKSGWWLLAFMLPLAFLIAFLGFSVGYGLYLGFTLGETALDISPEEFIEIYPQPIFYLVASTPFLISMGGIVVLVLAALPGNADNNHYGPPPPDCQS